MERLAAVLIHATAAAGDYGRKRKAEAVAGCDERAYGEGCGGANGLDGLTEAVAVQVAYRYN